MNVENRTLFIADNLDIMRGMDSETVDLIYLDPTFKSDKQFIQASEDVYDTSMTTYLTEIAVRLFEMKRILKPTGSIYLHCSPTASHYLKMVMDDIFGKNNFRNEITWKCATSTQKGFQHRSMRWGNNADILLFYAVSQSTSLYSEKELTESEVLEKFKYIDENGQRYYDDSAHIWSSPNMGHRPNLCYEWRGFVNPHPSGWRLSKERLQEEYQKGNIVIRPDGKLERRKYLKDYKGASYGNIWDDIPSSAGEERTDYPNQKPLVLLERIIKASSNEGDMVLDPFCGSATTCVAAERLNRHWVGIDISPSVEDITKMRLTNQVDEASDLLNPLIDVIVRKDVPKLTDNAEKMVRQRRLPKYPIHKLELFDRQQGSCNGCKVQFLLRNMTVDHIVAQKKGGTDQIENLQLLCGVCNSTKGDGTHAVLISRLKEQGVLK